ncbi:hypothetical protein LZG71_19860 [Dyadobacter sp. CY312]|nr:hypothetical protein [Dyadobacter sp. CY312]
MDLDQSRARNRFVISHATVAAVDSLWFSFGGSHFALGKIDSSQFFVVLCADRCIVPYMATVKAGTFSAELELITCASP